MKTNAVPVDIRDIKGLVPLPGWPWWVWLVIALVIAGGAVLVWWWTRRRRPTEEPALPAMVLSPYDVAVAALARLWEERPDVEEFYTRLADIIRHYIEGRFGLRAPERTTEEFLATATLSAQHMHLLGEFLQEADLVKFARFRPGEPEMKRGYAAAEKFVRETK